MVFFPFHAEPRHYQQELEQMPAELDEVGIKEGKGFFHHKDNFGARLGSIKNNFIHSTVKSFLAGKFSTSDSPKCSRPNQK